MTLGPADTVLCSGTLRRGITFRERLDAARAGGFSAISLWGRDYRDARDEGWSDADMVAMLGDHGLAVAEIDPAWWWPPGAADVRIPPELDTERIFAFGEDELFAVAEAIGAHSVNAVDVFGGHLVPRRRCGSLRRPVRPGRRARACSCSSSSCPGRRSPTSRRPGPSSRPPAGPTAGWRSMPGTTSAAARPARSLRAIPGDTGHRAPALRRAGGARARPDARHAARAAAARATASWHCDTLMADLRSIGAVAPVGVEVFSDDLDALDPHEVGRRAGAALRTCVSSPSNPA